MIPKQNSYRLAGRRAGRRGDLMSSVARVAAVCARGWPDGSLGYMIDCDLTCACNTLLPLNIQNKAERVRLFYYTSDGETQTDKNVSNPWG